MAASRKVEALELPAAAILARSHFEIGIPSESKSMGPLRQTRSTQHYLWRQGDPVQPSDRTDAGCFTRRPAYGKVSVQPNSTVDLFARRSPHSVSRIECSVSDN